MFKLVLFTGDVAWGLSDVKPTMIISPNGEVPIELVDIIKLYANGLAQDYLRENFDGLVHPKARMQSVYVGEMAKFIYENL